MSSSIPYDPAAPMSGDVSQVTADRKAEAMVWRLALAAAVTSVVIGVLVVAWPEATLKIAAVLFGLWLLVHGVIYIVNAITATAADGAGRALTAVIGILFVIAGVLCLRDLLVSLAIMVTVVGISWLIAGIVGLVSAFGEKYSGAARMAVGALGAVSILGGLVVLLWPKPTLTVVVFFTGIWLILMGIVQFVLVWRARPT